MIYNNVLDLIGNTPVIKLNFNDEDMADVYIKLEKFNIGGSVKDRAALGMIEAAERAGILKEGSTIVEPTSGNTGISLALIGRVKGYRVIITMPETMSIERRNYLEAYGAELILTEGALGMKGAIAKAEEIVAQNPTYFMPQQFNNPANPEKHYETTGKEIIEDFGTSLDAFVSGVGTSGTLSGVGKRLREESPNTKIYAVEPSDSPVLSGGEAGKHMIQGIGAGFVPNNYDVKYVDEILQISNEEAIKFGVEVNKNNGIFVGISSGAAIAAAYKVAKKLGKGKKVLTIAPDGGEKYLSIEAYK